MKVLFAVSNDAVSESIIKKYQQMYKEIIISKNAYYFDAILKELQKDKSYDRIVISEDLEPFTNNNYDMIDNFIFEKLDRISDEATSSDGTDIPIILITTERRTKSDSILVKIFGIGVYSALIGRDISAEEVCKLINKPRTKKEAKIYYNIDSNDVSYKPESEGNVSEQEIQNILSHYRKLGRNEDRYVDSFDKIASQYTDQQLKVIINFLPDNVKYVLEQNSPKYQQITAFKPEKKVNYKPRYNDTSKAISNSGIKVKSIGNDTKLTKPVIIPSVNVHRVEKVEENISEPEEKVTKKVTVKPRENAKEEKIEVEQVKLEKKEVKKEPIKKLKKKIEEVKPVEFEEEKNVEIEEETKKRRGRPKKVEVEKEETVSEPKKGRGRPKKAVEEKEKEEVKKVEEIEEDDDDLFEGFEQIDTLDDSDDFMDWDDDFPEVDDEDEEEEELPKVDNEWNNSGVSNIEQNEVDTDIEKFSEQNVDLESLLTKDKKIVAFVGTSKNGTSFIVNNLADMLSKQGIKTAILDLTKNRNAYYIYTKNEEELRKIAYTCTQKLVKGIPNGINVNANLDVYTSLPGENNEIGEYGKILETLVKNYSLVLLDCDFESNYGYLKEAQEIYLVQSMDVLTIQPLTAYLRDLKAKQVLDPNKLRAVINKYTRVKGVTEKVIIGGMAFYNDPAMSFMTELFNRETIKYCTIPFDAQVYARYLEDLINCNVTVNGYQKEFIAALRKLANMVYPLINNGNNVNKEKYNNPKYNKYASKETFSNETNTTLDRMKNNF